MVQNLDKIISDLKFVNEKLINRLDKIEPVLAKDKYQIEDVDFLKSVDFQVERFESFIEILLPLLETDDEGVLLKKSLIHNFLYSTLLKTKKRFDAIFNDDYQFDDDKLNDYKTRFFELGYCVEFIDNFIDDLRNQRLCFILLFAYFTNNKGLFDFNELVKTANNESDLVKRKKLYLSEYDRVNLLWLKTNNSFKSNIPLNPDEIDETEPYNEEADEEYQATKRHYFDFLDKCQKAIESINFQIKNSSPAAVLVQKPIRRTIIDEIKELEDRENSLEYKAIMEEEYNSFNRKLTDKEIELVRNDCNDLNDVFVRGLDIYETYFSSGTINAENLEYLKTNPFTGLLSNNYFIANVFGSFDDDVTIGTILELCFSDTIKRIENLDFTFNSTPDLNKEPKLKELIKTILKNNFNAVLLKNNLLQLAKEIRELINLVNDFTANETHPSDLNLEILDENQELNNEKQKNEINILSTEQIFKSGFVRAFIEEYYEEKIHSYYPDKDRLLYIMCSSHLEKHEVTKKQIETIKSEIHKLGREELSFAYLQSSKPECGPNFIETNQRIEFWLCQSAEDFIEEEYSFCPTYDTLSKLNDDSEFKKKLSYYNGEFWSLINKNNWPKNHNLMLEDLVNLEIDLVNQIEDDINNYNENGSWEIDFEEYEKYIESSRAIEELFNISQLLVQLNRLEMFQSFLLLTSQVETKTKEQNNKQTFSKRYRYEEREKVISKYLEAVDGCLTAFLLTLEPDIEYISLITLHTTEFTTALKELYFSDNKNKEEYYVVIHDTISRATFHINDDNLRGQKTEVWGAIIYSLNIANSYASELRFRETNRYFPFPEDINDDLNPLSEHDMKPAEINLPKSIKINNFQKKELTWSDFLINKSDLDKLLTIQNNFKQYEGKRLAILIHLLQNEYRILNIISKSKTHSRKHFICLFKEDNSFDKTYAINKYIDPFSNKLNLTTAYEFDADYVDVKEKLTKIIENPVV